MSCVQMWMCHSSGDNCKKQKSPNQHLFSSTVFTKLLPLSEACNVTCTTSAQLAHSSSSSSVSDSPNTFSTWVTRQSTRSALCSFWTWRGRAAFCTLSSIVATHTAILLSPPSSPLCQSCGEGKNPSNYFSYTP